MAKVWRNLGIDAFELATLCRLEVGDTVPQSREKPALRSVGSPVLAGYQLPVSIHGNFLYSGRDWNGSVATSWPTHGESFGLGRGRQNLDQTVLRPISGTAMNFSRGSLVVLESETHDGINARRIGGGAFEPHAQTGRGAQVVVQLCRRAVLTHDQVRPPILIVISGSRPSLFTKNPDSRVRTGHSGEFARAISFKQTADSCV